VRGDIDLSPAQVLADVCREDFRSFIRRSFRILEPGNVFQSSWHIDCIADHLQAQADGDGEVQKLIINLPPRMLKSVLVAQIYPAWLLAREAHHQIIGASYAHSLAERNVTACRRIVQDEWYLSSYPDTRLSSDANRKDFFTTTRNGQYKGTGVGGTITGFGCFVSDTPVITNSGVMGIGDIKVGVNATHCLSLNHKTDMLEWKEIEATRAILSDDLWRITTGSGESFVCTGNHPIYIDGRGYIEAREIVAGEVLVKADASNLCKKEMRLVRKEFRNHKLRIRKESKKKSKNVFLQQEMLAYHAQQAKHGEEKLQTVPIGVFAEGAWQLQYGLLQCKMWLWELKEAARQMLLYVWGYFCSKEQKDAILHEGMCEQGAFKKNDGKEQFKIQRWKVLFKKIQGNAPDSIGDGWPSLRSLRFGYGKNSDKSPDKQGENKLGCSPYRRKAMEQRFRKSGDAMPLLSYNAPQKTTVALVERLHDQEKTPVFDIQVKDNSNFFANGILVHNCKTLVIDDAINPLEAGSDTIRVSANEAIRGTLFSRWNDYNSGRLVLIMQRLHEDDPTGNLLADGGYHLLKLPAYTPVPLSISLGPKVWKMEAGDYLSSRLNKEALDSLETTLRHNFAGQYLQEPVPMGGGDFKEGWINYFDVSRMNPRKMNIVILCDPAGGEELNKKKKKLSDWTAFMVVGLNNDNNYYVMDIIRDKLNPTERVNTLFDLHRKWNGLSGKPPKVGYEKYGMMTDTHYLKKKMMDEGYHFSLVEVGGTRISKEERIKRLIPDMELGRWYFPEKLYYTDALGRKFDLVHEFVKSEMANFPRARNDDMIDALSRIYEPDLNVVFPRVGLTLVQKAVGDYYSRAANDSWQDY